MACDLAEWLTERYVALRHTERLAPETFRAVAEWLRASMGA
jgi:hypothetical protein